MNSESILRDLLQIPSPSGEESQIGEYLYNILKKDFSVDKQKIGNRFNIIATKGNPDIVLTTHMDTVPKQMAFREDKKYFYGRGACDAKASIASMIEAGEKALQKGIKDIALIFDVGEEKDFSGILKIKNRNSPGLVIVGEPTKFRVVTAQKGLLGIKIICRGRSAHGATPEKGISAIEKCLDILQDIRVIKWPNNKCLGATTMNIGLISGGVSANVVPDYAEATIEFRTTIKNGEVIKKILEVKADIEIIYDYDPVISKFNTKMKTITVPYFTEMYFWDSCCIVLGPGNPDFAHTDHEKILKRDLGKSVKLYLKIIDDYIRKFKNIQS